MSDLTIGGVQVTHTGLIWKTDYGEDTEHWNKVQIKKMSD